MRSSSSNPFGVGPLAAAIVSTALCLHSAALAQQQAQPSREREALRRAQAALLEAQQQRDAALADKSKLQRSADDAALQSKAVAGRQAALQREIARQREELRGLQAELQSARDAAAQAEVASRTQAEEATARSRQQLAAAQAEAAERTAAKRTLVARLEATTAALARSEQLRRDLHGLGLQAVQRYREKGVLTGALQNEPVLGLAGVRVENVASELADRIEAAMVPIVVP
jgi:chromosome segregation ATPase